VETSIRQCQALLSKLQGRISLVLPLVLLFKDDKIKISKTCRYEILQKTRSKFQLVNIESDRERTIRENDLRRSYLYIYISEQARAREVGSIIEICSQYLRPARFVRTTVIVVIIIIIIIVIILTKRKRRERREERR